MRSTPCNPATRNQHYSGRNATCFSIKTLKAAGAAPARDRKRATRKLYEALGVADETALLAVAPRLGREARAGIQKELKPVFRRRRSAWLGENDVENVLRQFAQDKRRRTFVMVLRTTRGSSSSPQGNEGLLQNGSLRRPMRRALQAGKTKLLVPYLRNANHWTGFFIHALRRAPSRIEYFDSFGRRPSSSDEAHAFFAKMNAALEGAGYRPAVELSVWDKPIQRGGSECGVFLLWYLTQRTLGLEPHEAPPTDADCNELRDHFFHMLSAAQRRQLEREEAAATAAASSDSDVQIL